MRSRAADIWLEKATEANYHPVTLYSYLLYGSMTSEVWAFFYNDDTLAQILDAYGSVRPTAASNYAKALGDYILGFKVRWVVILVTESIARSTCSFHRIQRANHNDSNSTGVMLSHRSTSRCKTQLRTACLCD